MVFLIILAVFAVSYLMGSVPTGYLVVKKLKGVDIRTVGSGNIGATNVKRILGMKWFLIVLAIDALKGFIPVAVFSRLFAAQHPYIPVLAAAGAILGHTFSIFLNFKGGKGVATALGIFLALAPGSMVTDVVFFAVVLWFFRYVSLSSILCAALLPVFMFIYGEPGLAAPYNHITLIFAIAVAAFVIYKHKDNIQRLLDGTENKFEMSAKNDEKSERGKK
ncbi:MAG: glycerol-3-phosphate 1-O-acyltransferase PlsY [Spirochaetia bacterium]|nr:glycerol-3-phosphate 1-O-acyltransferase PlsY [Spirochaetia bacterium]